MFFYISWQTLKACNNSQEFVCTFIILCFVLKCVFLFTLQFLITQVYGKIMRSVNEYIIKNLSSTIKAYFEVNSRTFLSFKKWLNLGWIKYHVRVNCLGFTITATGHWHSCSSYCRLVLTSFGCPLFLWIFYWFLNN